MSSGTKKSRQSLTGGTLVMKNAKALAIGFLSILVLFLASGCGKTYELPWDQFCLRIEDNREILLSAEDKGYIIDALNKGNWSGSTTDCECDFVFYTAKQEVRYHSECGTFNDCTNRRAFELSEEQRQRINEMLNVRDVARVKALEYDLKSVEHINMDCSLGWPDDIWESVLIILENSHFLWSENYQYKEESAKHVDKLKECDYSWVECERIIWSMTDKDGNPAELPAHVIDQTWNIWGKVEQHHFDLKPYTP